MTAQHPELRSPSMADPAELESQIRAACEVRSYDRATTLALQAYGPEIFGFLVARLRSESDAAEVFSDFMQDVWKALSGFEWRCPVRVWAYALARHAANRYTTAPHRRPARNLALSEVEGLSRLAVQVRTQTPLLLQTDVQRKMVELRQRLPLEDQTVLILRIDKGLSFRDLAVVMSSEGPLPDSAELDREAARLRKRFQLAKERLRELARAEGLTE